MRLSIVALNAYPALFPNSGKAIGGLETFAWRLAQGLAKVSESDAAANCHVQHEDAPQHRKQNVKVQLVVRTPRHVPSQVIRNVLVDSFYEPWRDVKHRVSDAIEICSSRKLPRLKRWNLALAWQVPLLLGNKLFGRAYSEQSELLQTLSGFRPDWIIALGVNETSSHIATISKSLACRSLLWLQSNADLDSKLYFDRQYVDPYGVSGAQALPSLSDCDAIVCQTATQLGLLEQLIVQLESLRSPVRVRAAENDRLAVIQNPIDVSNISPLVPHDERKSVLWIGRADRFHKRPILAIEIAKRCPNIPFTLVLAKGNRTIRQAVESQKTPNVTLLDYVPPPEMPLLMAKSLVFLSTGAAEYEGFPNVLLEAAQASTPIVSLEDFDGFLARSSGGILADGDLDIAAAALNKLATSRTEWARYATNGQAYVRSNHDLTLVVAKLEKFLSSVR